MEMERRIMPLLFVLSGFLNVLLIKWSDNITSQSDDNKLRHFQHPVFQTTLMFVGELLCFVVYKAVFFFKSRREDSSDNVNMLTRGGQQFSPAALILPAFLDAVASLLLFTGLYLTYVSSFQMLRSASIIFIGIFGSIYLNQALTARHWMALFTITCGIIVILSIDVQRIHYDKASLPYSDENAILTGNLLIVFAQIFHAAQHVYEEKFLKATDIPVLQATGWQGIFGVMITLILGVILNFLPASMPFGDNSHGVFDYLPDIVTQLGNHPSLLGILGAFVISSAIYNFAGMTVLKFSSAVNRFLADDLRIILIWPVAILLEWEYLNLISMMAFIILSMGTIAYRNAIFLDWYRSLLARLNRRRFVLLTGDRDDSNSVATNRPADAI